MRILIQLIFIFFLMTSKTYPQTGIVSFGEIQSMGMGGSYGQDYNAVLVFNKNNSLFITRKDSLEGGHLREHKKFTDSNGKLLAISSVVTNPKGFLYYNDLKSKTLYSRDLGFSYVEDNTIRFNWKILAETKTIGDYTVQKATASFRGRDYTAWFTTKIPLPFGPWKLSGLPGLILEAYDTHKEIYWYFKNIEYPSKQEYLLKKIKAPNNGWITFEEYRKEQIKSFLDSRMAGRMAAENIGASGGADKGMTGYIEIFKID
ncbi:MAG: GLPGLI family protein [Leeuwenhoekiella sp.]|nr:MULTISPECIES: GLPGLI family protein [Leeuwenhoekiella]MBQ50693.1 GLPGLI family protein [Leeuwenhoekiella sp.]HCW63977.1 GLPGLI family protein [Leeuwenhoekiella sp.]|tara:strand:- start:4516 stop:5295 length:780 start_codon:yes stop_codon:yes gene_type:complete